MKITEQKTKLNFTILGVTVASGPGVGTGDFYKGSFYVSPLSRTNFEDKSSRRLVRMQHYSMALQTFFSFENTSWNRIRVNFLIKKKGGKKKEEKEKIF